MGIMGKPNIESLLSRKEIIKGVVKQALKDPEMVDSLSDDVADKLYRALEKDYTFKKRLVLKALGTQIFKEKLIKKLK